MVLIKNINAQANIIKFSIRLMLNKLEIPHPITYIISAKNTQINDKNILCFSFILNLLKELTHVCVRNPLIIDANPKTSTPLVPPLIKSITNVFVGVGSIKNAIPPKIKLKNIIVKADISVLGKTLRNLVRPTTLSVLLNFFNPISFFIIQ